MTQPKSNLDKFFKLSDTKVKEGADFIIDENTSIRVRLSGTSNPKMKSALAKFYTPYARLIESDAISIEKGREIMMKIFAESCIVSWRGIEWDGQPLECNFDNIVMLFTHLPELFDEVQKFATDKSSFKEAEEVGNS